MPLWIGASCPGALLEALLSIERAWAAAVSDAPAHFRLDLLF